MTLILKVRSRDILYLIRHHFSFFFFQIFLFKRNCRAGLLVEFGSFIFSEYVMYSLRVGYGYQYLAVRTKYLMKSNTGFECVMRLGTWQWNFRFRKILGISWLHETPVRSTYLFHISLNALFINSCYTAANAWIIMDNKLKMVLKETVVE
jgi:hypothetical protein